MLVFGLTWGNTLIKVEVKGFGDGDIMGYSGEMGGRDEEEGWSRERHKMLK